MIEFDWSKMWRTCMWRTYMVAKLNMAQIYGLYVANLKVANLNGHAKFRIRGSLRYLVLNFAILCYEVAIF